MEEIIKKMILIACFILVVIFVLLIVFGCISIVREAIREYNDSKPIQSKKRNKRKLNKTK